MSRWDGGRGDLDQSAGGGSAARRCKRWGTRSGHHHEALATSERTMTPATGSWSHWDLGDG